MRRIEGIKILDRTEGILPDPIYDGMKSKYKRLSEMVDAKKAEYNKIQAQINELKSSRVYLLLESKFKEIKERIRDESRQLDRLTQERQQRKAQVIKQRSKLEELAYEEEGLKHKISQLHIEIDKLIHQYIDTNPEDFAEPFYDPADVVVGQGGDDYLKELTFLQKLKLLFS